MNLGEITLLQVQNLGKIKFASLHLDPSGNLIRVAGPNESGKSTLLDSLKLAFSNARVIKDDTIRHGYAKAEVKINTSGGYTIERVVKKNAKGEQESTLEVKFNGAPIKGGATTFLKTLSAAFKDPEEVAGYSNQQILQVIADYIGLDINNIETEIQALKADLTATNRAIKNLGEKEPPENYKPIELDMPALLAAHTAESEKYMQARSRYNQAEQQMVTIKKNITESNEKIARLQAELEAEAKRLEALEESKLAGDQWFAANPEPSRDALDAAKARVDEASKLQDAAKEFKEYEAWTQNRQQLKVAADEIQKKLDGVMAGKEAALASKQIPVANMNIVDGKVRIGETQWESCSTSQRLIAAAMLCAASIPDGGAKFLYIHRGESIGKDRQAMLADFAKKSGVQIFMEVMTENPESMPDAVVIEEGNVVYKQSMDADQVGMKVQTQAANEEPTWAEMCAPEPEKKSGWEDIF